MYDNIFTGNVNEKCMTIYLQFNVIVIETVNGKCMTVYLHGT